MRELLKTVGLTKRIVLYDTGDNAVISFDIQSEEWPGVIKLKGKFYYLNESDGFFGTDRSYYETKPFVVKRVSKKMDPIYY